LAKHRSVKTSNIQKLTYLVTNEVTNL